MKQYVTHFFKISNIKTLLSATAITVTMLFSNQVAAQCTGTSVALVWGSDNGTTYTYSYDQMINGKCAFKQASPGTSIAWSGTQWNIYGNALYTGTVYWHSTKGTSTMPPDKASGNWVADGGIQMISFSGTGTTSILPIALLSFTGNNAGASNNLQWSTATETNNASFEIERSANGVNFTKIGALNGAGTSSSVTQYTYTDAAPFVGTNYYRLKQIDVNGVFVYSEAIAVSAKSAAKSSVAIYPNPASNVATLTVSNAYLNTTAQLYGIEGKLQQTIIVKNNQQAINIQPLAKGIYMLKLNDGTILKVVKQ